MHLLELRFEDNQMAGTIAFSFLG